MHQGFRHLRYVVRWMEPATERHPKPTQRALADHMRQQLREDWQLTSRSHSRGTVAVAVANAPITRVGIDVEYADPARPWAEIAAIYLPEATQNADLTPSSFCLGWTFGEAHLKAFGETPSADLLRKVLRGPLPSDEPIEYAPRRWWYSEPLPNDFWLTLVWEEAV